ncbi:MAG: 4-(cytidine 5'-diphospho)-2-C-methyl-D-erythritol kinase [Elusimicrobiales bacterium]|nr:4-(cytidine 5'-diphospho)-2-C-methyl-D-erythritol kinase [Elusimicrobiales bacterium]
MIKIKAPAKINLFLEITGKRPDGFHDLETIFAKIEIYDELCFNKKEYGGFSMKVNGDIPGSGLIKDNIVYKAAMKFYEAFPNVKPAADIVLNKNIPVGAGLGGGSSDAAACLLGLCKLHDIDSNTYITRLRKIAAELGSDVPFFLVKGPAAIGRGRGEILETIEMNGRLPYVILVYPPKPVFTKEAYGKLKLGTEKEISANIKQMSLIADSLKKGNFQPSKANLFNRLEEPVLPGRPDIAEIKEMLLAAGSEAALMSGSGASCFGLASSQKKAEMIASRLELNDECRIFVAGFAKI